MKICFKAGRFGDSNRVVLVIFGGLKPNSFAAEKDQFCSCSLRNRRNLSWSFEVSFARLSSLSLFSRMVEKYHGYLMDTPSVYWFSLGWTQLNQIIPTNDFQGEVPLETSWKRGVGTQLRIFFNRLKFSRNEPILSSPGMSYVYFPTKRKVIFGTPECSKSQGWLSLCCFFFWCEAFETHLPCEDRTLNGWSDGPLASWRLRWFFFVHPFMQ